MLDLPFRFRTRLKSHRAHPSSVAHASMSDPRIQRVSVGLGSDGPDAPRGWWLLAAVFLASALGLYLEMVMVRWHASCFHTFGVFKNVSMLSCFLGLGIGYALAGLGRRPRVRIVLPILAIQCLVFAIVSGTRLGRMSLNPVAEHYIMWQSDWRWWVEGLGGNAILAATFALNAVMFIPLGHVAGELMGRLPRLGAYALNLAGSLAGIGLFVGLSALWAPPVSWMGLAVLGLSPFLTSKLAGNAPHIASSQGERRSALGTLAACLAVMLLAFGLVDRAGTNHFYSPYQTITCRLGSDGKYPYVARLMVNQASFQRILDLSPESQARDGALQRLAEYYDLPHRLRPKAGRVLVVGAGSGNDVAAALRADVNQVTAVEIDPTILFLGERLHPERPYSDARVQVVSNDARTYLRRSHDKFDLIIYGLLDSHTLLGNSTNVRLDSFVYTVEGFREAAARLSDDGLIAVTFALMTPQQGRKLFLMLEKAFGHPPRCFEVGYDAGVMMVAGPALPAVPATVADAKEVTAKFADARLVAEVSTDDWPFFYMPRRTYPVTYSVMIVVLLAISIGLIIRTLGVPKLNGCSFSTFFFLGAGFMLIETKAVTQLGLVLGNTWQILAVVVCSILLLAFVANFGVILFGPVSRLAAFVLLAAAIMLEPIVKLLDSIGWHFPMPEFTMPIVLTLPLLFSGLIFSSELSRGAELSQALAANLFGAMLGGFLEYNSMYWGYASLTWLGMGLYGLAFLSGLRPIARLWRADERARTSALVPPLQTVR